MFNTIVVGTDGSTNAERAVTAAAQLAQALPDARLHIVTAYRPLTLDELTRARAGLPDEFREVLNAHTGADATLDSARSIAEAYGVSVETHEVNDRPIGALLDLVEELDADLVVVGSRGEGLAGRTLHGSVSTKVQHHAPCSVLVVHS